MKKYYHATPAENFASILAKGLISNSGYVYLAETSKDAIKFVALHGVENILIVELELSEEEVAESFDHSYTFFQCRAFTHKGNIPVENLLDFVLVELGVSDGKI